VALLKEQDKGAFIERINKVTIVAVTPPQDEDEDGGTVVTPKPETPNTGGTGDKDTTPKPTTPKTDTKKEEVKVEPKPEVNSAEKMTAEKTIREILQKKDLTSKLTATQLNKI